MIRLYHFPLSPFCRKVRLTLAEKKIEVELVEERYWEPSPDFLRRNPAGKVPVLKMDTRVMSESQAICEYLVQLILYRVSVTQVGDPNFAASLTDTLDTAFALFEACWIPG